MRVAIVSLDQSFIESTINALSDIQYRVLPFADFVQSHKCGKSEELVLIDTSGISEDSLIDRVRYCSASDCPILVAVHNRNLFSRLKSITHKSKGLTEVTFQPDLFNFFDLKLKLYQRILDCDESILRAREREFKLQSRHEVLRETSFASRKVACLSSHQAVKGLNQPRSSRKFPK